MFGPLARGLAVLSLVLSSSVLAAETRAVLVGVSDYDDTIGLSDLKGPANDVRLLADVLDRRGVAQIVILADGVTGGIRPTRQAILDALQAEAAAAQPGDFVYLHFSGHGTRQRDTNGDETDGLDEVFLPADTARAEPGAGLIPNALIDDELGAAVDAIRAKGAHVWLVLDSCHAGSGLRAATPGSATRFVDPAILGVSATPVPAAGLPAVDAVNPDLPGGFLAFYAAQSDELAREVDMARDGTDAWYGLFSATLAARIDQTSGESFRQMFQGVLSDLNDTALPGVARLQTPSWDGTLIDAVVFGGTETRGLRRFAVTGDEMAAGLVQGIPDGTLVTLYADAADPPEALLGHAQTVDGSAVQTYLNPVDADCVPQAGALCARAGALPREARFAQVLARPVDMTVAFAPPRDLATGAPLGADHPATQALTRAVAMAVPGADGFALRMDEADYHIETIWDGSALWMGRRAALDGQPVGLRWSPEDPLAPLLNRIGQAETLARRLGAIDGGGAVMNRNPVNLFAEIRAVAANDLARPGDQVSPVRECRGAIGRLADQSPVPLEARSDLKQCDQLFFSARGRITGARDVNRVHIDAQFCIHAEYERIEGNVGTRPIGPEMTVCSDCPGGSYSAGDERLFLIVTEAAPNAEALRLEGLLENCGTGAGTRGPAQTQAMTFFETLARRPDTRGSFGSVGISNIWVERRDWTVQPREEVFRRAGLE